MAPTIKTPNCPECGREPYMVIGDQAWCGNVDSCEVLTWNPTQTVEELRANRKEVNLDTGEPPRG